MKNIFLALFICLFNMTNKDICDKDLYKYQESYKYIVNDSINKNKLIYVSNEIINMDLVIFGNELKRKEEDEFALYTRLYSIPKEKNFYSDKLHKSIKFVNNHSKTILFFSHVINDSIICAELFDNKGVTNEFKYERIAFQNESYLYLFIFDQNKMIKQAYRKKMLYSF